MALYACDDGKPTTSPKDYKIVKDAISEESKPGIAKNPIIKSGEMGDLLVPVEETEQLKAIYAKKEKNAKFWSIKIGEKQVREQIKARAPFKKYCLTNIMTPTSMKKNGWEGNTCDTRLFCGSIDELDHTKLYAVELCGD